MADSTEFENRSHEYANIQVDILARLEKTRQQSPERFPKPIYVLAAVHDDVNGQWEQRLRQAKKNESGECIILIPYHVGDDHWIGVLLKFKANEQIERAEFFDPVKNSNFVPDKLQKEFTKIYSDIILQSRNFQKHDDPEQSAALTVENLLEAAEEVQSTNVKDADTCGSQDATLGDQNTNSHPTGKHTSLLVSAVSEGNNIELDNSIQITSSALNSLENKDDFDSPVEVSRTEQPNINESDQSNVESCKVLKERLKIGLTGHDINDEKELEKIIIDKRRVIESLKEEGKHKQVQRRQNSLTEFEQLQSLVDQIKALESSHANDKYEALKKQLEDGLAEHDISSKEELKRQIIDKKEKIQSLVNEGKHNLIRRRQNSLSELEQLQSLVDQIKTIESFYVNDDYEVLKKQLEEGLGEHDISSQEELKRQIINKKEEIQSLAIEGKHNIVRKRQSSLSELEKLQLLVDKIDAIKPLHPNSGNRVSKQSLKTDQQSEPTRVGELSNNDTSIQEERLVTDDSLKNMYQDFCLMPVCSERSIISLLFYVSLKLVDNTIVLDKNIKIPDQIETEIVQELECLKKRLQIEELLSTGMQNSVEKCFIYLKDENWTDILIILRKMLKQISPLDMPELLRLITKVDDAAKLIKDKEIILFLGGTGSGKSTTIHFLSGSKMVETKVKGLNHITFTEIKNIDLKKITTTPFSRSETRYITPVKVNYKDVGAYNNGSVILCDSPGFYDTNGPEVDIANGIGIIKAIKGCRSVKPVVLFSSQRIGDKGEGVKEVAHLLAGLIPGIREHIKAFSYIFTKFSVQEANVIHARLKNINEELNEIEKSDISSTTVLIDMLQKTEKNAQVLNPLKDRPGPILDELTRSAAIYYPEEVFQFFITQNSKTIVQEHVRQNQLSIMSATKRSEYSFIKYKLDELKCLYELLGQDNIEQIYNDCIRYISKHISEEYQEGISAINRSIMNQIVLNIEDIQQYQTRCNHAKLAEELRKEHLGKEVIHSSAFIYYLNQQVDILFDDLREKDINDLSVKINLDKIKLLLNSFSDLDYNKYKNICQLFGQKFEIIVKSFKSSVLSNTFDKSANDLGKLFDALTILHDHLNTEDMKIKYVELKEYFFKYLNDSSIKIEQIFTQEKVETNDVENLNSYVCILESAINTSTFEPHISIKDINTIYENLVTKILDYVKDIICKIDTQFKNENSFHILEQYMEQLDLIRTISIINHRTSESYWKTLEKLVGYIHESRRLVEEQLKILFRREEKVNYTKLTKCLSNLKGAKWIEKYRSNVYSDLVNDVEQQLIQHVKTLKESVMEVDLNLDNFNKIKYADEIVLEINEMKAIERIVSDVSEHIDAVNTWFIGVTNNVFVIIKDTFNIEKWKEQGYRTVDFNKAEKAFSYLDICKNIRILFKNDCMLVLNSLDEFIKFYSDTVQKELGNYFDKIKQFDNKNKGELFENARTFASRLQEISEMKTTYIRVYASFPNKRIVENWQNDLSNYLIELSDEMEKLRAIQRVEMLSEKLLVAQALSRLDKFLQTDKYIDIYTKYQSIFFSQTNDICKQVIDAIKNTDYEQVSLDMIALQSSSEIGKKFFEQARRALIAGLDNLMEETKTKAIMLGNNIEIEGIKMIVENLRRLQRAKQFVSEFLNTKDEIDICIAEVKKLTEERIKRFLESVRALITVNNFYEADKKIDSIILVRAILGNYCTEDVSVQIEDLKERQNKVVLEDIVKKYSEMDISGYTLNPPTDIFAKFGEVNNTNPVYHEALNRIKESIFGKFRQELTNASLYRPPNPENIHIRKFKSAIKHLPDTMRNALEVELQHCKEDISLLIRDNETNLDKAFTTGNLKNIKRVLVEYQKSEGMQYYVNRGRELVLKQMQDMALTIIQNFEKYEIIEALDNIKKLYDYKIELEQVIIEIKQSYSEVQSRIKSTFHEAYLCFTNRFLNNNMSDISNEKIEAVEKSFICLIEFMKFNYEYKGKTIVIDMFPDDFNRKIAEFNKNILQYFTELQKKNKDALEKLDITSLKNCLDTLNRWNSLIMKMKSYDSMHSINDPMVINTVKAIKELTSYSQMLKAVYDKIEKLRDELINQELINNDTKEFDKQRYEFYRKFNEKFLFLHKAKLFDIYEMNIDIHKIEQECLESLERKISEIFSFTQNLVEKFVSNIILTKQDSDNFSLHYNNLLAIKQEMKVNGIEINKKIQIIQEKIFQKIQIWEKSMENEINIENIAMYLINMKQASHNMPSFGKEINERIDKAISHCKNRAQSPVNLGKLGIILQQDRTNVGSSIISEHNAFIGHLISLFVEKTRRHGIDYVLENLTGDLIDKNQLKKRYDEFRSIYEKLVEQHLKTKIKLDELIADTILITGDMKINSNSSKWEGFVKAKIPKLTAHVFALWTVQNSTHYFEAGDVENKEDFILQPHVAQIISIFRMLGIGDKDEEIKNNLVQIGTGEGKSVTLGATAAILALLGFDVRCACYSEYLSQRDYAAFLPLFNSLGLLKHIHYGTFNKLCEDMIKENVDIRQTVEKLISTGSNVILQNSQQIKRPKILLIDEVDVFFSRDFYGNVYIPSASLRDSTITSLINFIWKERNTKLNLNKIKLTNEYKACCNRFPNWEPLLEEIIKDMLFDVNNFEFHDYVVNQDKIGYIEQDGIVYNVVYGYKTLFAYHCEHEKGKISRESLEENICMKIKCGSFSYAEIPLEFKYIMGVTGTLKTLSDPEKRIIQNVYKIMKNTFIPSVFGKNNLRFTEKDDIMIENSDDYFNKIRTEIDDRLRGKSSEKRAVLVLFESKQKLKEFYESKALEPIKNSVVYLTEEASLKEKEHLIRRATTSGQITLLTKTFGRGTDFICHDQSVAANGGLHVIQTFLSEEVSEEVQTKGRTARQGDQGSYSMILLDHDLEKFQIERDHIEDVKKGKGALTRLAGALNITKTYDTIYDLLNDKRINLFKIQYEANMKYVEQAKERHRIAQEFLSTLNSGDINSVRKFLVEENKGAEGNWISRTICLMDATSSMTHLLHKCKNTVDTMFERASVILQENNLSSDSFQIQFVVYRNYNSKEDKILQTSPWETKPDYLRAFMNSIEVEGGWRNEAIEVGLWHANRENEREPITQVILIGDAPPNLEKEVKKKREYIGEDYWKKTKFAQPIYYEDELAKLLSNNIPVHSFFVAKHAEAAFTAIANATGGRCQMLDINSASGAHILTDLVTEEILRNVGGSSKGEDLVKAYRDRFVRSYI